MLNIFFKPSHIFTVMRPAHGPALFNQKRLLRVSRPFAWSAFHP